MKISFLWLKEFVDFTQTPVEIAALLLRQGFEVASVTPVGGSVTGVVVAQVESAQKHPNADKLKVCEVFDGVARHTVVCGAPNVEAGKKYPFARLGATLPDGLVIEKRPLRGVESHGMLCSARELGLGADHSGLYSLPSDVVVGQNIVETLALNDVILEIEVTPNRPDVLSHWGVAREVAAGLGKKCKIPTVDLPAVPVRSSLVRVDEPALCDRYVARALEGVSVKASPLSLRLRLERCGIRSINNVVDVTNYVLLEYGHPLHSFDRARLAGRTVGVRKGRPGEKLECLDAVTRDVNDILVIADANGPVAAAGVMGGQSSAVGDATVELLLESARFLPSQVRQARGRLGLSTESSYRFERGTDFDMADIASRRAASLILSLAGGRLVEQEDVHGSVAARPAVRVSLEKLQKLLGLAVTGAEARAALESLDFKCEETAGELRVTPPIHRADVREMADVVEEVARRIGYDRIPGRVRGAALGGAPVSVLRSLIVRGRERLIGLGFWEAAQSGLVPRSLWDRLVGPGGENPPELLNPLSLTGECLNPSLLMNLLACAAGNVRRGNPNVRLFESARVFHRGAGGVDEADHLAWVAVGQDGPDHWKFHSRPLEIWDARGWAKSILKDWRLTGVRFEAGRFSFLHPAQSQSILMGDHVLGYYGRLHPRQAEAWELPADTFVGELNLSLAVTGKRLDVKHVPLSRQPALVRDFSLVFPETVTWSAVVFWIHRACEWVEGVDLFDVFTGQGLAVGTRSLGFRVTFRHPDRTVTDGEAHALHERVLTGLGKEFSAHLRAPVAPA
ncbi:MAG: phenylalanine--tRNA ligase subunit beta [Elusimicrobia bacterium]|nr:phenylalanine--tRNA ligase subunit beta [Elusimicrobiota bacterium]